MNSLICFFCFLRDYSHLMHPRPQGTRVETQDCCSPVLSLDAPAGFRKDIQELASFHLFQGSDSGFQGQGGTHQFIRELQYRPGANDHGPFNDAFWGISASLDRTHKCLRLSLRALSTCVRRSDNHSKTKIKSQSAIVLFFFLLT